MVHDPNAGYCLLNIDTEKAQLSYKLFKNTESQDAEQQYGDEEKRFVGKPNIVIALVSTTSLGGIREAYPNYFADSSNFVDILHLINSIKVKPPPSSFRLPWLKNLGR